ncbi:hypothetical protein ABIQ69_13490 [Agromyces sp. G08B096]|uniref:Uncharacterized protein n=1 Tax=Agromyces sp. G08B096 TaxID=3156399 RepID=A0AAU7W6U9_9MICO
MTLAPIARTWLTITAGSVPLLALLLVPELMRSRAGSEQLLMIGMLLLLALLVAAFVAAPVFAALADPAPGRWTPGTAFRSTRRVWRRRPAGAWLALGVSLAGYAAAQVVGYAVGAAVPAVSDNPAFAEGGTEPRWLIDYPAYALQAVVIYLVTTLALTWYARRIRALALELGPAPSAATATATGRTVGA